MPWVIAGGIVLAVVTLLMASALVEVYRQLAELRTALHLEDIPRPLTLRQGELRASDLGLPAALAGEPEAIAVFLTTTCSTCLMVAEMFRGGSPSTVWFVLPDSDSELAAALEASEPRLVFDEDATIADRAGLNVAPSVLTLRFGEVVRAQAVSTPRQVLSLVPAVTPRGTPELPGPVQIDRGRSRRPRKAVAR